MSVVRGPQEERSLAGDLIASKYRLVRSLGRGGMGEVWEAEHAKLGSRVAIKLLRRESANDADIIRRFRNEARAAAGLQSRFIVQVLDDGVADDGRPVIVMELLRGESLGDRLARRGSLAPAEVLAILRDVCKGLALAHDAGIVHRDLKPDNVFLHQAPGDDREVAKLLDFGVAKLAESGPGAHTTQTGSILGTPNYMSPEHLRGAKDVDRRSDLWSLGVVVYRCLTGEVPFRGATMGDLAVLVCTTEHAPPSTLNPSLPRSLDGWAARALAKSPEHRFQTAMQMLSVFEQAVLGVSVTPPPQMARPARPLYADGDADTLDLRPSSPSAGPGLPRHGQADTQAPVATSSRVSFASLPPPSLPPPPPMRGGRGAVLALGAVVGLLALGAGALLLRAPGGSASGGSSSLVSPAADAVAQHSPSPAASASAQPRADGSSQAPVAPVAPAAGPSAGFHPGAKLLPLHPAPSASHDAPRPRAKETDELGYLAITCPACPARRRTKRGAGRRRVRARRTR